MLYNENTATKYIYSMIVGFQLEGILIGCAKSLLSKIFESAYQYK